MSAWRDLQDHEADAFLASGDGVIAPDLQAEYAARRLFGALAKRYGPDAARGAFKAAAEPGRYTLRQIIKMMMEATHDTLKADGVRAPTATTARAFSGGGLFGQGRTFQSAVRALRPTRRAKSK